MPIPKGQLPARVNGQPPQQIKVEKRVPQDLDLNKLVERARAVAQEQEPS